MFINETYDQLIMETAMGEGEYLTTALELMSCDIKTSQVVISQLRSDLQQASSSTGFTNQDHADKAYQFYSSLNQAAVVCAG
ncbi:Protein of unknown function [Ectothiorhodospira magna]|uniref:Uncharacterized protein n=2 Tax=Ectothiorhodospira magna TaxID=867345 RepID=A0A1H9C753_9GAMM|nr:Protein of unknown function [Ectothiorhodospira magna]